jgi:hypothetical protein
MGVALGWNVLSVRETLLGTVTEHFRSSFDGDWELKVSPAPGFESLLTNSSNATNAPPQIGCEVEPTDSIDGDANENKYFSPLLNRTVLIDGAWVEDRDHGNVTELHPIYSIFSTLSPPGADPVRVEFFALSDDSANIPWLIFMPPTVPFSGESQFGSFKASFPPTPADPTFRPTITFVSKLDMADSSSYKIAQKRGTFTLLGEVHTGIAPNHGFYHAVIDLSFAPPPDPQRCSELKLKMAGIQGEIASLNNGISTDIREGHKPSHEDLQTKQDLGHQIANLNKEAEQLGCFRSFPPVFQAGGECAELSAQITAIQAQIKSINDAISQDVSEGDKPSQDDVKEKQRLAAELAALRNKSKELNCL